MTTSGTLVDLRIDPTLISDFRNDEPLYVTLRMGADLPPLRRADIKAVVISARLDLPGLPFVVDALPSGSRVIVESGTLSYRSAHHTDHLFRDAAIRNDLSRTDDVRIETPLNRAELRNPREEDKELARNLLAHLNEHIEEFHHLLWEGMSNARRYMLLDGFEAPNSGGRSVASVVNNELIGIVGNSLVMPLARGFHLDPTFSQDVENPIDLIEHYQPNTPIEPSRIAVPTPGVYAEAVMGACNSCEQKDETRFWRWEESPLPDSPPQILPVSTESRRAEPPDLSAKDFAAPIIAMQNAPAAPDPTGLAAAFGLLSAPGSRTPHRSARSTRATTSITVSATSSASAPRTRRSSTRTSPSRRRCRDGRSAREAVAREQLAIALEQSPQALKQRMPERTLLQILACTAYRLNCWRRFGPASGSDAKLADPLLRYVLRTFTYGANISPAQAARHVRGVSAHKLGATAARHFTTAKLNRADADVLDAYRQLDLVKAWSGATCGIHRARLARHAPQEDRYSRSVSASQRSAKVPVPIRRGRRRRASCTPSPAMKTWPSMPSSAAVRDKQGERGAIGISAQCRPNAR